MVQNSVAEDRVNIMRRMEWIHTYIHTYAVGRVHGGSVFK